MSTEPLNADALYTDEVQTDSFYDQAQTHEQLQLNTLNGLRKQADRTALTNRITTALIQATDEPSILGVLSDLVRQYKSNICALTYFEVDAEGQIETAQVAAVLNEHAEFTALNEPLARRFRAQDFAALPILQGSPDQTIFIENTATDLRVVRRYAGPFAQQSSNTAALIFMPLRVGQQWQGLITFNWTTAQQFDPDMRALFESIRPYMASVVANRRLLLAEQAARAETEVLYRIGEALNVATTFDEIVTAVAANTTLHSTSTSLTMYEHYDAETASYAELVANYGELRGPMHLRLPRIYFSDIEVVRALQIASDVEDRSQVSEVIAEGVKAFGFRAFATVPLSLGTCVLGVLNFFSDNVRLFTDQDRRLLMGIGRLAGGAMERGRLRAESDAARERAELLSHTNSALSQAADEPAILSALSGIVQRFGATLSALVYIDRDATGKPLTLEMAAVADGSGDALPPNTMRFTHLTIEQSPLLTAIDSDQNTPIFWENISTDPSCSKRIRQYAQTIDMAAFIIIPLHVGDTKRQGMLWLGWSSVQQFSPELREMVSALQPTVAAIVASHRLLKQTTTRYQSSERQLKTVINSAPLVLYVIDKNGIFTLSEGKGLQAWGLQAGQVVGLSAFEIYKDVPNIVQSLRNALNGQSITDFTRVGDIYYQNWYTPLRDSANNIEGVIGVAIDISARRLAEIERETLLKSEQLARREAQDAVRLKDLFLATMSHELRTPLNAMIGFQNLMLLSGELDDDNAHMAERSLANSHRLLNLINNVLDISRMASGGMKIVPILFSPRVLAKNLYGDMNLLALDKQITLNFEIDEALPERIYHDEERIAQIVLNLVGNAIKFTERGTVTAAFIRQDERLIIRVTDSGIGMPPSRQHVIFDDFVQLDNSSTRKHQGAGLGLSIVKRLLLLMKGTISLTSEVEKGSVFTVDLPLELPHELPLGAIVTEPHSMSSEG